MYISNYTKATQKSMAETAEGTINYLYKFNAHEKWKTSLMLPAYALLQKGMKRKELRETENIFKSYHFIYVSLWDIE